MANFLFILLFSVIFSSNTQDFKLKQINSNYYSIEFSLDNNIDFLNKGEYTSITSSDGYTTIIGMPKLPMYSSMVMLDPTKEYEVSYEVKRSRIIDNIKVAPNQRIINGLEKKSINDIDNMFYSSEHTYPLVNVSLTEPMVMRDIVTSNIIVIPFNYTPSENTLEVYESMDIHITEVGNRDDLRVKNLPKSRVFENIYQNEIINYEASTRNDDYQTPAILYICSGSLESNTSFQQLVEWRRQRGYVVYTASTSSTGSSSTAIKNFIQNAYENYSPTPEYVALVGDVDGSYSIPTYYEDFGHDTYGNDCEGDHPYSQLDGNDLLPEVLIGRMSIRTTSELSAAVNKIINYEKATYLGNLGNYFDNAAMFGDPSSSGNSCAITNESLAVLLENHGFEDVYLQTSGSNWSSNMRDKLTDGVLYFNYRGYLGMSGFSTNDIDSANNGFKLPFATVLTCGTGSFSEDQTCMSEKFFRAGTATNPKGGVAAIGTATWNTHTLFNNIVDLGIYHGLLANQVETAGAALASGKFALYNTYPENQNQWISSFTHWNNLIGDPATHLWTDTPKTLNVTHPEDVSIGTNYITVRVEDSFGNLVDDAFVTLLSRFGVDPINKYTDSNGEVTFDLGTSDSGVTYLTVTKNNYKPYTDSFLINDSDVSINIDNGEDLVINDGNDGIPQAGESFGLSIPLYNYGIQNTDGVTAILTSDSNLLSIENNTVSYGSLSQGQTVYGNDFNVVVSTAAIQGEDLGLILTINDSQNNQWTSIVPLDVIGSYLNPTTSANIQPGQTSNINVNLINQGSLNAQNVVGQLSYSGNLLTINDANGAWGNVNSGSLTTSSNSFNITASNDIVSGTQLVLTMLIEDSNGYSRSENFALRVGNVSVDDPLGPDEYGYYIYDSGDEDYDLSPDYSWIEIDPGNGGSGSNLNLSNSGNGNWNGNGPIEDVNLPFTFTFYGIEYDQMSICTNGWVSFGNSTSEAFRNYPIPGAGGPSPMVAAFWDDLETGNNSNVFFYSSNNSVIVQWTDMRTNISNSNETFQMILYNDSNQPYGDNSIKIQYKDFNNTSAGNFNSYPPIHGSYSTIGIENHLATDGLQYSYDNNYPTAAMNLSDNTALYITTQEPITLPAPQVSFSANSIDFELNTDSLESSDVTVSNNGESGSLLDYDISQEYPGVESPFSNTGGGPDGFGYFWGDSNSNSDLDYNWIDIDEDGTQVSFEDNDAGTSLIDIGFDFPFYGQSYSQFRVNANGWIGFGDNNDEWYNTNIPSTDFPRSAIFGFWDDLNPLNDNCNEECAGNVFYHSNSNRLVVWFDNVAHWSSGDFVGSYYDFEIVIFADGAVEITHRDLVGNYTATVGMQNASGTIATQINNYDSNNFNNTTSYRFEKPFSSSWMSLLGDGLSGSLLDGEQFTFQVQADTDGMPEGDYSANILVATNAGDTVIPVDLTVGNDQGILGDINGDTQVNVTDIVQLVNIILSGFEYSAIADLNQDGQINVADIVQLVNMILN